MLIEFYFFFAFYCLKMFNAYLGTIVALLRTFSLFCFFVKLSHFLKIYLREVLCTYFFVKNFLVNCRAREEVSPCP